MCISSARGPQKRLLPQGTRLPVQYADSSTPRDTPRSVVDGSGRVGVRGRRRRCRVVLLVLDVRFFVVARTAVVGRATHVVGVRRDAVANSLQDLQTCVCVGVVPLQTRLYALVIDDTGLLLCPPYCHSTTGASNVCGCLRLHAEDAQEMRRLSGVQP